MKYETCDVRAEDFRPVLCVLDPVWVWMYRVMLMEFTKETSARFVMDDPTALDDIDSLCHILRLNRANLTIQVVSPEDLDWAMRKHFPSGEERGWQLRKEVANDRRS